MIIETLSPRELDMMYAFANIAYALQSLVPMIADRAQQLGIANSNSDEVDLWQEAALVAQSALNDARQFKLPEEPPPGLAKVIEMPKWRER
jgi:hypothetical protein